MSTLDWEADHRDVLAAQIAWLESNDPDEWHRVMLDFNWDEPLNLIHWIVTQPECDLGTALHVFWVGQPTAWLDEVDEDAEPDDFSWLNAKICADIAHRVAGRGYQRAEIAFQPEVIYKTDFAELEAMLPTLERPTFPVPRELIMTRPGRTVENDMSFYDRYPEHLRYSTPIELPDFPEWAETERRLKKIEKKAERRLPRWLRKA